MKLDHQIKPLLILPAAGYGTRVGSPEAKELLPHPNTGLPLIEKSLNLAKENNWDVHVITRKEKQSLIEFLKNYGKKKNLNIEIQIVDKTKEWPDSILKSENYWHQKNIFILPDTEWNPMNAPVKLLEEINADSKIALGVFHVDDLSTWGAVSYKSEKVFFCEKPQEVFKREYNSTKAWGLIAFDKSAGKLLFELLLESTFDHQWKVGPEIQYSIIELNSFFDLTR